MRGIRTEDLSPRQIEETRNSLEQLANQQLGKLAERMKHHLGGYATATTTRLVNNQSDRLMMGAACYEDGAYLDAIEHACTGLDLKEEPA